VKKYILFDHDGVLVDTEFWYYKAGERALADVGLTLDKDQYLRDMNRGLGTWAQAGAAGIDEQTIGSSVRRAMTTTRNTSGHRPSKSKASPRCLPSCHGTPAWPS
jgi:beta-phosphoglucomutase-like phosphatase (HAD superfamily)